RWLGIRKRLELVAEWRASSGDLAAPPARRLARPTGRRQRIALPSKPQQDSGGFAWQSRAATSLRSSESWKGTSVKSPGGIIPLSAGILQDRFRAAPKPSGAKAAWIKRPGPLVRCGAAGRPQGGLRRTRSKRLQRGVRGRRVAPRLRPGAIPIR